MSVAVTAPPTAACCRVLPAGMHAIVFAGRCLACLPQQKPVPDDDDRGDTLIRSTLRRDRFGRAR